jgi:hypothetical protein
VIGGGSAEGGAVERHMIGFPQGYKRRGIELELGERLALGYQFHIASSREQAICEAAPHYEENMKMFGEFAPRAGIERRADCGDAGPAAHRHREFADDRGRSEGRRFSRRPEDIIEALKAVEWRYPGLDRVICATPFGTRRWRFGSKTSTAPKEVIPAFRATGTAVAAE